MPREYDVHFTAPPPAMYVISRDEGSETSALAHEGRVRFKGEIRARGMTSEYRALLKDRVDKAGERGRGVAHIADDRKLKRTQLNHRQVQVDERLGKQKRQERLEQATAKRAKQVLSARELKEKVRELFAKQNYWSRRDLVAELGNDNLMGDCLGELADKIVTKGLHYGEYVLKAEFRTGLSAKPAADVKPRLEN